MMKKITAILLSMFMILSLAACGNSGSGAGQHSAGGNPVDKTADNDTMSENSSAGNTGTITLFTAKSGCNSITKVIKAPELKS